MSEAFYNAKNFTVSNGFVRNPDRYYLEEYFVQRPVLNADIQNSAEGTRMIANTNFEILGANASSDDVTFSTGASSEAGIVLTTDTADNDQVIVLPHLDTNQTAWTGILWGTENQVEWECAIRTGASIANVGIWAGLKLTNTPVYATDDDQAYFLFATDNDMGAITTTAKLHFVYSISNTDYITDLGIALAASTTYKLRIVIDSNRQVSVYVNGVQYGLTSSTTAGGTTQTTTTTLSTALTDDIDLIPYVGVQALVGSSAKTLTICYEKISRVLFE
jgi:hypothetical protein